MVDFTPRRAATSACTSGSSWFCKSVNSSSVLANAHIRLLNALRFCGGSTPALSSAIANLSLDIIILRSSPTLLRSASLRAPSSSTAFSSMGILPTNFGSVNMRTVISIRRRSREGICGIMMRHISRHSIVSFMQYSP